MQGVASLPHQPALPLHMLAAAFNLIGILELVLQVFEKAGINDFIQPVQPGTRESAMFRAEVIAVAPSRKYLNGMAEDALDGCDFLDTRPGDFSQILGAASPTKGLYRPGSQPDGAFVITFGFALTTHHTASDQLHRRPLFGLRRVQQQWPLPVTGGEIVNHSVVSETAAGQREGLVLLGVDGCPRVTGASVQRL